MIPLSNKTSQTFLRLERGAKVTRDPMPAKDGRAPLIFEMADN